MLSEFLQTAEEAARAGGRILVDLQGRIQPRLKGYNDLVTEADVASQRAIRAILLERFPDHDFLGEECENALEKIAHIAGDSDRQPQFRWIVDPLDGTTNYVHTLPNYSVSIALERGGEILIGVVYDPVSDECYRAAVGQGAELNGRRIQVSDCRRACDALMAVSFAPHIPRDSPEVARFLAILHASQSIRRLGSAALNLCFVAAGRLDGYVAASVKAWDVAAGMLIVREAGGRITGLGGQPLDLRSPHLACAATCELHAELLAIVSQAE